MTRKFKSPLSSFYSDIFGDYDLKELQRAMRNTVDSLYTTVEYYMPVDENPKDDIKTTTDEYKVSFDVPGFEKENLDISYTTTSDKYHPRHTLTIEGTSGERKVKKTLFVPSDGDLDNAVAEVKAGVLTLEIPRKKKETKVKRSINIV